MESEYMSQVIFDAIWRRMVPRYCAEFPEDPVYFPTVIMGRCLRHVLYRYENGESTLDQLLGEISGMLDSLDDEEGDESPTTDEAKEEPQATSPDASCNDPTVG